MIADMSDDQDGYRVGRHVVHDLSAQVVLVTKYRGVAITDRVLGLLISTSREVCERFGGELIGASGELDYLCLSISYPPRVPLSTLIMSIKTSTSKRVRGQGWDEVTRALHGKQFWSPSYLVVSTGENRVDQVWEYLRQQREPNRKQGRPKTR